MKKYLYRRMWIWILIPISIMMYIIADANKWIAEHVFSGFIFYYPAQGISSITGLVPFSIAEFFIVLSPVIIVMILAAFFSHLGRAKGRRKTVIYKAVLDIICLGAVIFFVFTIFDGINYYRYDFAHYAGLNVEKSSSEQLYLVGEDLVKKCNETRNKIVSTDDNGVIMLQEKPAELAEIANRAYLKLGKKINVLDGHFGRAKAVYFSKYMSYTELVGIFVPFTLEANVNVDTVAYNIPGDMCHELAHLHGFIKEDEANYISYLACLNSGNTEFEYSGYMQAYIYVENALYNENPQKCLMLDSQLSDDVALDIRANSEYWNKIEESDTGKKISETTEEINDAYLKANGQNEGVKSYGLMVDLLMAQYRRDGFFE